MHAVKIWCAAVLAPALAACGSTDVSGTWSGVGSGTGTMATGSVAVTLTLQQNDNSVTGSGTASGRGGSDSFDVSGSAKGDDVDLAFSSSLGTGSYHAKLDGDDKMSGTYSEPGFTMTLALNKE